MQIPTRIPLPILLHLAGFWTAASYAQNAVPAVDVIFPHVEQGGTTHLRPNSAMCNRAFGRCEISGE
jgi:hypothetical protein